MIFLESTGSAVPAFRAGGLALLAAFLAWGTLRWLLISGLADRVVDLPNARSLHVRPIPRIGGAGIVAGALLPALGLGLGWPVALGALLLAALSLVDDLRGLPAALRLGGHLLVAAAFTLSVFSGLPWWAGAGIVLLIGWMTNLFNFMDGANGLAGGMAAFGFSGLALPALAGGAENLGALCGMLAAAALAFLRYNFGTARVFLGDLGSIPLGFSAGAAGALGWAQGVWPAWFVPFVFAPFVADASVTLLRRALRGEPVWRAHREHYYQRLILMGWSHRRTALAYYALMAACVLGGWGGLWLPDLVPALLASVTLGIAGLMWRVDRRWSLHAAAR